MTEQPNNHERPDPAKQPDTGHPTNPDQLRQEQCLRAALARALLNQLETDLVFGRDVQGLIQAIRNQLNQL